VQIDIRPAVFDRYGTVGSGRVLIVDSDCPRCDEVVEFIEIIGGFETLCTRSAGAALTVATEFRPDFVLMNTDLSDLDCYQLASAFQQRAGLCRARLIALTAEIAATDRQAARLAGFEQFLTLPLQQTALERVLTGRSHRGLDRTSGHWHAGQLHF
jgi:CheY-like chemotaxis protein